MGFEIAKGMSIYNAIKSAKNYLDYKDKGHIDIVFNEIELRVSFDSNITDITIIYNLTHELRRLKR